MSSTLAETSDPPVDSTATLFCQFCNVWLRGVNEMRHHQRKTKHQVNAKRRRLTLPRIIEDTGVEGIVTSTCWLAHAHALPPRDHVGPLPSSVDDSYEAPAVRLCFVCNRGHHGVAPTTNPESAAA